MTTSITNDALGVTVSIGGTILIDGTGADISVPLPYNGVYPWGYDFDIAGNANNFVLFYSGEFGLRDGKLVSLGEPNFDETSWNTPQDGVTRIGGAAVAQFYRYNGEPLGDPIWISSQGNGGTRPGIGALSDGSYLAVWQVNNIYDYPVIADRICYIVGRTISPDGSQLGETFVIAAGVPLLESNIPPTVTEVDGQIIVGWNSYSTKFGAIDVTNVETGQSNDISNIVYGTDADDVCYTFGGSDSIYGKGGDDLLDSGANQDTLNGGSGSDTLDGGLGGDNLIGGAGGDTLNGGGGADTLYAGNGDDTVDAGAGNDLIVGGDGAGNDTYIGGAGVDTVKYTSALAGITVDLAKGTARSTATGDAAGIGSDTLSGIENIIGGNFADRLNGSGAGNKIQGMDGDDQINGRGGNDILIGGKGNDVLIGGAGKDSMTGGLGADRFSFANGHFGGATEATADLIKDFSQAEGDQIDLSLVDANSANGSATNEAFSFIGTSAFSNVAGELRYMQSDTMTYVQGDANGDGVADFVIALTGTVNLTANDFA